jgi:hypothetical protein
MKIFTDARERATWNQFLGGVKEGEVITLNQLGSGLAANEKFYDLTNGNRR